MKWKADNPLLWLFCRFWHRRSVMPGLPVKVERGVLFSCQNGGCIQVGSDGEFKQYVGIR